MPATSSSFPVCSISPLLSHSTISPSLCLLCGSLRSARSAQRLAFCARPCSARSSAETRRASDLVRALFDPIRDRALEPHIHTPLLAHRTTLIVASTPLHSPLHSTPLHSCRSHPPSSSFVLLLLPLLPSLNLNLFARGRAQHPSMPSLLPAPTPVLRSESESERRETEEEEKSVWSVWGSIAARACIRYVCVCV